MSDVDSGSDESEEQVLLKSEDSGSDTEGAGTTDSVAVVVNDLTESVAVTDTSETVTDSSVSVVEMATSFKIPPPVFGGDKRFEQYMMEVDAWCAVTHGVAKNDQALLLALSLPDEDPTNIKDKLFNDIPLAELNCEGGVTRFKAFMNNIFTKDDLTIVYERFNQFEKCQRDQTETVEQYILKFDQLYNRVEKKGLKYPEVIKA